MMPEELYAHTKFKRSQGLEYILVHHWDRQPEEQWQITRQRIFERDQGKCQSPPFCQPKLRGLCLNQVNLETSHIDHIRPLSSGGSNHARNLRTLCPICHALREDSKHRGMIPKMVEKGFLPVNWKHYVWD